MISRRLHGAAPRTGTARSMRIAAVVLLAVLAILAMVSPRLTVAQTARIKHTVTKQVKNYGPSMGRDLWLSMAQNYEDQGGKWYTLYVSSPNTAKVKVEVIGNSIRQLTVQPNTVVSFDIPLGWEIKSSGEVEDKAIHVWSDESDITAYLMSHNPATTDGMYIVPPIGWGTEYVVAGYYSLFEGFGNFVYDYPSEFVVVANQNNTQIDVTPTQDIRGKGANVVLHAKGIPFHETLNRGQAVQYQLTQAQNADDYDVTGTIVKGNQPFGIIGASQCPNIPMDYPYCDHVCDMIPPIRTWAATYYTAPFINRKNGDTYLVIGSKKGQTIWRTGAQTGKHVFAQLAEQYEHYYDPGVDEASVWTSDTAFLLVQYINSSTWDNGSIGDPAMVVVNSVEEYTPEVLFATPPASGSRAPYQNYVNVIVNNKASNTTYFDGKKINSNPRIPIDGKYDVYRISNVKTGAHYVKSDSGVGVYIYGYGWYESYAWTGALGTRTYNTKDTVAPATVITGSCFNAHVDLSDVHPDATKLGFIRLDSVFNMAYFRDPTWIEGVGRDLSNYDMFVVDSTQEAFLQISVYDLAGNQTTIKSTYQPQFALGTPPLITFGVGTVGQPPAVVRYATITNQGKVPFKMTRLELLVGSRGFTIDSVDRSDIGVGESRKIRLGFIPNSQQAVTDTLLFGDECITQTLILAGSGGAADFIVTDDHWGNRKLGTATQNQQVVLSNNSGGIVNISKITVDDPTVFSYDGTSNGAALAYPIVLKPNEQIPLDFTFHADVEGFHASHGHFFGDGVGEKVNVLDGTVTASGQTFTEDKTLDLSCVNPGDTSRLQFEIKALKAEPSRITGIHNWASTIGNGADTQFVNVKAVLQNGQVVNPTPAAPVFLGSGDILTVYADFAPPAKTNGVWIDSITAEADGLPFQTVHVTATTHFADAVVSSTAINFGTVTYASTTKPTQTIDISNNASTDVEITAVSQMPGKYPTSFSVIGYTYNGMPVTLPITLHAGEKLVATVQFDPAASYDATQDGQLVIASNSCVALPFVALTAGVKVNGNHITGYQPQNIFACAQENNMVMVYNDKPGAIVDTVISAVVTGVNASNFAIANVVGTKIPSLSSIPIAVTFTPTLTNGPSTYAATVEVHLRSQRTDTTIQIDINGTATTAAASARSIFATQDQSASAGTVLSLPIDFNVNKNGVTTSFATMNIKAVRLTYDLNSDLLSIVGSDPTNATATAKAIATAVTAPTGWSVDQGASSLNGNTLVVVLRNDNGFLDESLTSLGSIAFRVTLPKTDNTKTVALTSMELLRDNNGTYDVLQGCVTPSVQSGEFSLIYLCGDKTLQDMMNGNQSFVGFIKPATPNPATSGLVKFQYGTRIETPVTLAIYDVLGNEVARVVDNVFHRTGVYEVGYDVSKLPSGTYTYRLTAKGSASSKQFVVSH